MPPSTTGCATQLYGQPSATGLTRQQQLPTPPFDSLFRKFQQEGIREYRMIYDRRAADHFTALQEGRRPQRLPIPKAPISRLAHQNASRHLGRITEYVPAEARPQVNPTLERHVRVEAAATGSRNRRSDASSCAKDGSVYCLGPQSATQRVLDMHKALRR